MASDIWTLLKVVLGLGGDYFCTQHISALLLIKKKSALLRPFQLQLQYILWKSFTLMGANNYAYSRHIALLCLVAVQMLAMLSDSLLREIL